MSSERSTWRLVPEMSGVYIYKQCQDVLTCNLECYHYYATIGIWMSLQLTSNYRQTWRPS